jgi:hypothetical protein
MRSRKSTPLQRSDRTLVSEPRAERRAARGGVQKVMPPNVVAAASFARLLSTPESSEQISDELLEKKVADDPQ